MSRASLATHNSIVSFRFSRPRSSTAPISVHYLSPLVLRKELENIIDTPDPNTNHFYQLDFMEQHPILFWNLVKLIDMHSVYRWHLFNLDLVLSTYSRVQSSISNASTFNIVSIIIRFNSEEQFERRKMYPRPRTIRRKRIDSCSLYVG
jgi:hypothetical protein